MKNYLYLAALIVPSIALLAIFTVIGMMGVIVVALVYLYHLPTTILDHLENYDLEQARKNQNIVR